MACTLAVASGGGGAGGTEEGNQHAQMTYDKGKKLFYERVVCEACQYAGLELESAAVSAVWSDLKKDLKKNGSIGQELTKYQRKSVKRFLKKRFSL
jgi:uncharacterized protein (DUF2225 family)